VESEFNSLGYFLLGRGRRAEAVKVLAWTAQNHPDSWNAFDSLGEAYLAAGDTAEAVRSYRRSLQLNPQNSNASAILARLLRQ
jgi:cytochrome c-type biogenesis protein CcmH/NrfG